MAAGLHGSARATPQVRAELQASQAPPRALARRGAAADRQPARPDPGGGGQHGGRRGRKREKPPDLELRSGALRPSAGEDLGWGGYTVGCRRGFAPGAAGRAPRPGRRGTRPPARSGRGSHRRSARHGTPGRPASHARAGSGCGGRKWSNSAPGAGRPAPVRTGSRPQQGQWRSKGAAATALMMAACSGRQHTHEPEAQHHPAVRAPPPLFVHV